MFEKLQHLFHLSDSVKGIIDVTAVLSTIAALAQLLPHFAALLGVVWWIIRIYNEIQTARHLKKQRGE
jgi:hypothetical protein